MEKFSWKEAESLCTKHGYDLFSVNSHEEWNSVTYTMMTELRLTEIMFLGLHANHNVSSRSIVLLNYKISFIICKLLFIN